MFIGDRFIDNCTFSSKILRQPNFFKDVTNTVRFTPSGKTITSIAGYYRKHSHQYHSLLT